MDCLLLIIYFASVYCLALSSSSSSLFQPSSSSSSSSSSSAKSLNLNLTSNNIHRHHQQHHHLHNHHHHPHHHHHDHFQNLTFECPKECFCNEISRIAYCQRKNLNYIPSDKISANTIQLHLNGNRFQVKTLQRSNFSTFTYLEHLYLGECGIVSLDAGAFADLGYLRWLDLSYNNIEIIPRRAFEGLHLEHLFLNGNKRLYIHTTSFIGLSTQGLYLHNCTIENVDATTFVPLRRSLKFLWLNDNKITFLSNDLEHIFLSLEHIRLASNPLRCNCNLIWLKIFYDQNVHLFNGTALPTCMFPANIKHVSFDKVLTSKFTCVPPTFGNIELLMKDGISKFKCEARGDPSPTIYWVQPSGQVTKYAHDDQLYGDLKSSNNVASILNIPIIENGQNVSSDQDVFTNEGILEVDWTKLLLSKEMNNVKESKIKSPASNSASGVYTCLAVNKAGNSTLSINISADYFVLHNNTLRHPLVQESAKATDDYIRDLNNRSKDGLDKNYKFSNLYSEDEVLDGFDDESFYKDLSFYQYWNVPTNESQTLNHVIKNSHDHDNKLIYYSLDDKIKENPDSMYTTKDLCIAIAATHVSTLIICVVIISKLYKCKVKPGNSIEKPIAVGFIGNQHASRIASDKEIIHNHKDKIEVGVDFFGKHYFGKTNSNVNYFV